MTTLLFSTSFSLFYRVLMKNPFSTILCTVFTHTLLVLGFKVFLSSTLMISDIKTIQRLSPYFSQQITNPGLYNNNRFIVLGVCAAVLAASYIILWRREKFYIE